MADTYQLTSDPSLVVLNGEVTIPEGHRFWDDYQAWLAEGNVPSPMYTDEQLAAQALVKATETEVTWREIEMVVAREQVTAISYGDTSALPGTEEQWKAYWIALRAWKDGNPDFPNEAQRPTRPEET